MSVHVEYQFYRHGYAIYLYRKINDDAYFKQPDGTEIHVEQGMSINTLQPTMFIHNHEATELIEALQNVGVQPKQLTLIEGKHQAQTEHLKDLQNILRKKGMMS